MRARGIQVAVWKQTQTTRGRRRRRRRRRRRVSVGTAAPRTICTANLRRTRGESERWAEEQPERDGRQARAHGEEESRRERESEKRESRGGAAQTDGEERRERGRAGERQTAVLRKKARLRLD